MQLKLLTVLTVIRELWGKVCKVYEIYLEESGKLELVSVYQWFLRINFMLIRVLGSEMSKAERLLSYSLLSLITAKPLASAPMTGINEEEEGQVNGKSQGLVNTDGAWCWRENCEGDLIMAISKFFALNFFYLLFCTKIASN